MELESKPFSPPSRKGFIQTHSINLSSQIAPNPLLTKNSLYFTYSSALVSNNFSKRLFSKRLSLGLSISHTEIQMQPNGLARCLYPCCNSVPARLRGCQSKAAFAVLQETHGNTMSQPVTQKEAEEDIWEITDNHLCQLNT